MSRNNEKSWRKNIDHREYDRIQKAISRHFIYYASQVISPEESLSISEMTDRLNKYLCPSGKAQLTQKTVLKYLQKAQKGASKTQPFLEVYSFNPEYLSEEHCELDKPKPGPIKKKYQM